MKIDLDELERRTRWCDESGLDTVAFSVTEASALLVRIRELEVDNAVMLKQRAVLLAWLNEADTIRAAWNVRDAKEVSGSAPKEECKHWWVDGKPDASGRWFDFVCAYCGAQGECEASPENPKWPKPPVRVKDPSWKAARDAAPAPKCEHEWSAWVYRPVLRVNQRSCAKCGALNRANIDTGHETTTKPNEAVDR
jgi:hypothetical protein